MNRDQVVALMEGSRTVEEWDRNCDAVKQACGGRYPAFWYEAVIASGLKQRKNKLWKSGGGDIAFT